MQGRVARRMPTGLPCDDQDGTGGCEEAMVEIATLGASSLNGGDLEQMATELFDILTMTVKDDAPHDHPGDHKLQRIRDMEAHGGSVCAH